MDLSLSESDSSMDSASSVNVYQLMNSKYEVALAMKDSEIKDLKDQLEGRQGRTGTHQEQESSLEEVEKKQLLESVQSTAETLLKWERDLQDIRHEAAEEVKKLRRENLLLKRKDHDTASLETACPPDTRDFDHMYASLSKVDPNVLMAENVHLREMLVSQLDLIQQQVGLFCSLDCSELI